MSFIHYNSRRGICSPPANYVSPSVPRDFQPRQHGGGDGGADTIRPFGARPEIAPTFVKPDMASLVNRLPCTPISTTSGFGGAGHPPTSGLPCPFYRFDAMHTDSVGTGNTSPELDFREMTSSDGYSLTSGGVGGVLQRYANCRVNGMTCSGPAFLSDRSTYVNGGTLHPVSVSVNSDGAQQMSPPSAITPTSPTAAVYPWMTIVGQYI